MINKQTKITIFHYHLLPGGVTNVIILGIKSLILYMQKLENITLVCGNKINTENVKKNIDETIHSCGSKINFKLCVDTEIDYSSNIDRIENPSIVELSKRLTNKYGGSFWWIHNYQLGKNPLFTAAILMIAKNQSEQKMLLHIHDFPECARYKNLESLLKAGIKKPYPVLKNISYAVINKRDKILLQKAGIPQNRVYLVDNPVEDKNIDLLEIDETEKRNLKTRLFDYYRNDFKGIKPDGKIILYPVRSIRRKNVLEAGLITALSEEPINLVISLPGNSTQEKRYSNLCHQCFKDGLIPGIWGSGAIDNGSIPSYPQMLRICDMILSSSVQEGFGYLFINAIKLGLPLVARYLDTLDGFLDLFPDDSCYFYKSLKVPVNPSIIENTRKQYQEKLDRLGIYLSKKALKKIEKDIRFLGKEGIIDFSYLSIEMQINILKEASKSPDVKNEIVSLNSKLLSFVHKKPFKNNKTPELFQFSLKNYSKTVEDIINRGYSSSLESIKITGIQQALIDSFAELEYMRLLYDY